MTDPLLEPFQLKPLTLRNRIMTSGRRGFDDYLKLLDLDQREATDPLEILAIDGGYRATDQYEVFPKIERRENGAFRCRFFLHGWRHTNDDAKRRLNALVAASHCR